MSLANSEFEKKVFLMFRNQFNHSKRKSAFMIDPFLPTSINPQLLQNLLNAFTKITLNDYIQIRVPLLQIDLKNHYIREFSSNSHNKFHFSIGTITESKENRRVITGFTQTQEITQNEFNKHYTLLAQELCQRIFDLLKLSTKKKPALSSEELLIGCFILAFKELTTRDNKIIKASYFQHYLKDYPLEKLQQYESAVFDIVYTGSSLNRANSFSNAKQQNISTQEESPESQNILRYIKEQHQENFLKIAKNSDPSRAENEKIMLNKLSEWTQKLSNVSTLGFINQYIQDLEKELKRVNPSEKKYEVDEMSCPIFLEKYVQLTPKEKLKTLFELYLTERSLATQILELSNGIATLNEVLEKEKIKASSAQKIKAPISMRDISRLVAIKQLPRETESPTSITLSSTAVSGDTTAKQHGSILSGA